MLDAGIWMLDSGIWMLDAGIWIPDAGFWHLDSRCWILASGIWNLASGIWHLASGLPRRIRRRSPVPPPRSLPKPAGQRGAFFSHPFVCQGRRPLAASGCRFARGGQTATGRCGPRPVELSSRSSVKVMCRPGVLPSAGCRSPRADAGLPDAGKLRRAAAARGREAAAPSPSRSAAAQCECEGIRMFNSPTPQRSRGRGDHVTGSRSRVARGGGPHAAKGVPRRETK